MTWRDVGQRTPPDPPSYQMNGRRLSGFLYPTVGADGTDQIRHIYYDANQGFMPKEDSAGELQNGVKKSDSRAEHQIVPSGPSSNEKRRQELESAKKSNRCP